MSILDKLKKINSKETFEKIEKIVEEIELNNATSSGAGKKEIAVKTLNEMIDIPFIGEGLEGFIIGLMVDKAVYYYNKFIWKNK